MLEHKKTQTLFLLLFSMKIRLDLNGISKKQKTPRIQETVKNRLVSKKCEEMLGNLFLQ